VVRHIWGRRFFATTPGKIVTLLRRRAHTVDELASAVQLSDNAVRNQLQTLERDGLITSESSRRGPGKPAWLYSLSPEAERLFPKPYATVLDTLLDVLGERLPPPELEAALDDAGRRLAHAGPAVPRNPEQALPAVVNAFADIGSLAEIEHAPGAIAIQGYDCPLARAATGQPQACRVLQAMLEEMLGQPVTESCDRGPSPRCRFLIPTS
jgi:predicted ArsR family transcriptional regulator